MVKVNLATTTAAMIGCAQGAAAAMGVLAVGATAGGPRTVPTPLRHPAGRPVDLRGRDMLIE